MNWFYNIVIAIGGIIIGVFGVTDEIAKRFKAFQTLGSLTFKILVYFLGIVLILLATYWQSIDNESETNNEKLLHKQELRTIDSTFRVEKKASDSIYQKKLKDALDSSYSKSIKSSNEALAKYNIVLIDSLNRVADKINIATFMPQLTIVPNRTGEYPMHIVKENNQNFLAIKLQSSNATSYNVRVACYIFQHSKKLSLIDYQLICTGSDFIVPNTFREYSMLLSAKSLEEDDFFVVLFGEFSKDPEGKAKISYRQSATFFKKENQTAGAIWLNLKGMEDYLKSKNIFYDKL